MVRTDLHCFQVLEVNASPAMARDCELDRRVKEALVRDTVALVDPLPFDRNALVSAIERRRRSQLSHGPSSSSSSSYSSVKHQPASSGAEGGAVGGASCGRAELLRDLKAILKGRAPRAVGEVPERGMGNYERMAPGTALFAKCTKLKAGVSR